MRPWHRAAGYPRSVADSSTRGRTPHTATPLGPRQRARTSARRRPSFLTGFLLRGTDLLVDLKAAHRVAITVECAGPGSDRFIKAPELEEHVAVMILNHRVGLELVGSSFQVVDREIELVALVVRPAQAVQIRTVFGVDFECLFEEGNRLVEPLAP